MPRLLQCWLKVFAAVFLVAFAIVLGVRLAHADSPAQRSPLAQAAEGAFFGVFNGGEPKDRAAALFPLMAAYATGPDDARVNLLLGLNHLWMAAEGDRTNPRVIEDLILAERFLARAQELNPADGRIPSWLVPVRSSLARIERRPDRQAELDKELLAAYEKDPDFHSFSVALFGFANPRDSKEFQRGLEALRRTGGCGERNPSCQNRPHWPHNREAFMTFHADYELKAGHADTAAELLRKAQAEPDFPTWPFRGQVEERLKNLEANGKLFADADPKNDPPMLMAMEGGIACQSCHRGK